MLVLKQLLAALAVLAVLALCWPSSKLLSSRSWADSDSDRSALEAWAVAAEQVVQEVAKAVLTESADEDQQAQDFEKQHVLVRKDAIAMTVVPVAALIVLWGLFVVIGRLLPLLMIARILRRFGRLDGTDSRFKWVDIVVVGYIWMVVASCWAILIVGAKIIILDVADVDVSTLVAEIQPGVPPVFVVGSVVMGVVLFAFIFSGPLLVADAARRYARAFEKEPQIRWPDSALWIVFNAKLFLLWCGSSVWMLISQLLSEGGSIRVYVVFFMAPCFLVAHQLLRRRSYWTSTDPDGPLSVNIRKLADGIAIAILGLVVFGAWSVG